ncbi:MAG TPA: hypothetical protein VHX87_03595 [Galbitalea sp.]|jgi:uncharacterized protein with FMN-binding domain|nr:hypothetical protein [Galbitalea sp.]
MTHQHRINPTLRKSALIAITGFSVVGALAGCSAAAASDPASTSNAKYKDGTYTAPGSYVSPGGEEHISVTLSLKKNIITAMNVVTVQADPTATGYEQMFEAGIAAATIGRNINSLDVSVVAGSSLTSMGFNKALATIKADAKE